MKKKSSKKVVPVVVEYPKVYVKCELAYTSGGESKDDGPYADRETEYRHYEVEDYFTMERPEGFGLDSVEVPDWKNGTDTVYAILVHYSTGDTFGRTEGCIDIPIAFVSVEEANKVAKEINSFDKRSNTDDQLRDPKYGFYKGWTGYFESMTGVEVKKLTLQEKALYKSKK
jgi:hypothetical protein